MRDSTRASNSALTSAPLTLRSASRPSRTENRWAITRTGKSTCTRSPHRCSIKQWFHRRIRRPIGQTPKLFAIILTCAVRCYACAGGARTEIAGGAWTKLPGVRPDPVSMPRTEFVLTSVFRRVPHRCDARADACPPAGDTGDAVRYGTHRKPRPGRDTARTPSAGDATGSHSARQSLVADVSTRLRGTGDFSGTAGIHLTLILSNQAGDRRSGSDVGLRGRPRTRHLAIRARQRLVARLGVAVDRRA